jgi:hypothetical protein
MAKIITIENIKINNTSISYDENNSLTVSIQYSLILDDGTIYMNKSIAFKQNDFTESEIATMVDLIGNFLIKIKEKEGV